MSVISPWFTNAAASNWWNSAVRASIPAIVLIVFAVLRRYLPNRTLLQISRDDEKRFSILQWAFGASMLGIAAVFLLSSYFTILKANHFLATLGKPAFVVLPTPAMWLVFPVFGALCVPYYAALQIWKRFDSWQSAKYEAWENRHAQFNGTRVFMMVILCIELPIGIATVLAIPIHAAFSATEISVGHFGALHPAKHPYSDLNRIIQADGYRLRDGSFEYCPSLILYFSDGTRWSSASNRDCAPFDERITDFVEEKAHIQSQHIEILPRLVLFGDAPNGPYQTDPTHR